MRGKEFKRSSDSSDDDDKKQEVVEEGTFRGSDDKAYKGFKTSMYSDIGVDYIYSDPPKTKEEEKMNRATHEYTIIFMPDS